MAFGLAVRHARFSIALLGFGKVGSLIFRIEPVNERFPESVFSVWEGCRNLALPRERKKGFRAFAQFCRLTRAMNDLVLIVF